MVTEINGALWYSYSELKKDLVIQQMRQWNKAFCQLFFRTKILYLTSQTTKEKTSFVFTSNIENSRVFRTIFDCSDIIRHRFENLLMQKNNLNLILIFRINVFIYPNLNSFFKHFYAMVKLVTQGAKCNFFQVSHYSNKVLAHVKNDSFHMVLDTQIIQV